MYEERFKSLQLVQSRDVDPSHRYDVAYLIRMKNEARFLGATLKSISQQNFSGSSIIIFLDSGSVDGSIKMVIDQTSIPYLIYSIDHEEFQFGATCNLVAELANADYFVFLSGHVVIRQDDMIGTSIDFMTEHPSVAGLSFRQVPNEATGFNLYEQVYLRHAFPQILQQPYIDVRKAGAFSNACSIVRASAWRDSPFEHVGASEDQIWADTVMSRGMEVYYTSVFDVAHSHNEDPAAIFRRVRINKLARFGDRRQPLRFVKSLIGVFAALSLASKGRQLGTAMTYAVAHASAYMAAQSPFRPRK